jgi:hypothetical protein
MMPASKAVYTPLIDMTPSDPTTMMTAMLEAKRLTEENGQIYTVFTADQQLYRVMVNVVWVYPEIFSNFVPRLGGMHMLMSFVGCIGVLMANSGLEEIMKAAFGGVARMLTGKKYPQNVRALRMITEEVLHETVISADSEDDLMVMLKNKATQSRTAKLWVECLIIPVFIIFMYVRAEREGDWPLHLVAVKEMMPYFFAAGHINYARYGLYYLKSMEQLPRDLLEKFLKGEHVMRHKPGIWNGIWSDMFIESTFMRYGHGPGGIVGITLNPNALKRWAMSLHVCSRLTKDISEMRDVSTQEGITLHKEEMPARVAADSKDREKIHNKLTCCTDPLNPPEHVQGIINIVTGQICTDDKVNVDNSVSIGKKQMKEYQASWPEGFNAPINKKVVTMQIQKKHVKIGKDCIFDTDLIYARVMGLMHSRDLNLENIFHHELAPIPTSMFKDNGDMRITTSKATLKTKLKVEQSFITFQQANATIIDGCAALWVVHWPTQGTVQTYLDGFFKYILEKLSEQDVYLVFDRYYNYSIKSGTRNSRAGKYASRLHKLTAATPLPPQNVVLTVKENKVQIIDLICGQLIQIAKDWQETEAMHHSLVITGSSPVPTEIHRGVVID